MRNTTDPVKDVNDDFYLPKNRNMNDRSAPENWANIADQYMFCPILGGDGRVLVQEDPFKSRYDCSNCGGRGHLGVVCKYCKGTRFEDGKEENGYCRDCTYGESGMGKTLGFEACPDCKGQGGIITVPDESKKNTTTGNVLAISRVGIKEISINDKIMFTNYTGTPFRFLDIDFRIMTEKDILGKVKMLKKNVDGISSGTYADLENTGTVHEE